MNPVSFSARRFLIAAGCAVVLGAAVPVSTQQPEDSFDRGVALRVFHERVERYAALHRRLEGPLPPLVVTRETVRNYVVRQLLANAIRKARAGAHQGDIFTPGVAHVFRGIIADALKGRNMELFLADLHEDHAEVLATRPIVNEPYPVGATHEVPSVLLHTLPALAEDVEYRIVDHDLVLWDIHASLVIDYLPNAFTPIETTLLR